MSEDWKRKDVIEILNGHTYKISELEASSASHTENLDAVDEIQDRNWKARGKEIAELREKLELERKVKVWDAKVINRMNKQLTELKEELAFNATNIGKHRISIEKLWTSYGELKEQVKNCNVQDGEIATILHLKTDNIIKVLRELAYYCDLTVEAREKILEMLDVGSARQTVKKENKEDLDSLLHGIDPAFLKTEKKEECKHKNTESSSDPSIWYICIDCGAHLNQKFEKIPYRTYDDIFGN